MSHRSQNALIAGGLALVLLPAGDEFAAGVRAYRAGRYQDALAAFVAAEAAAGDAASAELLYNKALAALRVGALRDAEVAAEKAAVRGGPAFNAVRDFLRGNAAFARCERAEAQASGPEAEPAAFDLVIVYAEQARGVWQQAAASRPDWPEARRNVERALRKIEELQQKRAAAIAKWDIRKLQDGARDGTGSGGRPRPQILQLKPDLVQRLLDKLAARDKQKTELRRRRQQVQAVEVEKDW